MPVTQLESTIRTRLLESHRETLQSVIDAGHSVATAWPTDDVQESGAVTEPLERLLREQGLTADLLGMLQTGTAAINDTVQGRPIPAPPYLVITSRGPLCRGTLSDGRRLVVVLELFAVRRSPTRYRFRDPTPEELLSVSIR
ncbi:hypothetical protein [Haloarcula sp. Atlit-7R]|uniref:hypothetical protein n=1 Tax=Haloarcula sp. Atlit-7R TaxID=2282125 RepID=UPI0011C3D03C|nr:hypothetical protein [Haloarcula sp. Atlit-7R]